MSHLGFCNDCFDHVFIWNNERIICQRERIIGQRSRNNRENNVEIWNRIIGTSFGIIGSGLPQTNINFLNYTLTLIFVKLILGSAA